MSDYLADLRAVATKGAEHAESIDHYTHSTGVMSPVLLVLLDAADVLQHMVEDGHPCSGAGLAADEWFIIASERVARVRAATEVQP